jgi:hypothetical protein
MTERRVPTQVTLNGAWVRNTASRALVKFFAPTVALSIVSAASRAAPLTEAKRGASKKVVAAALKRREAAKAARQAKPAARSANDRP